MALDEHCVPSPFSAVVGLCLAFNQRLQARLGEQRLFMPLTETTQVYHIDIYRPLDTCEVSSYRLSVVSFTWLSVVR